MSILAIFFGIVVVAVTSALPASAEDKYGLGGGSSLPQKASVGVFPGQELPRLGEMLVENIGTQPAEVAFTTNAPQGLAVVSSRPKMTLQPGEAATVQLSATIDDQTAPGDYSVIGQYSQTNVPPGPGGTIAYAPAVNTTINFAVKGATSTVTIKAVSENDGSPVAGNFVLGFVSTTGQDIPVATQKGTQLTAKVAPGRYRATFEIPGLVSQKLDFVLEDNETRVLEIKLKAVSFFVVGAKPQKSGDAVTSANIVASVKNDITPIPGPVTVVVNVSKDGQPLETTELDKLPTLPSGLTDLKQNYVPAEGFKAGSTYAFEFQVITPKFTVTGPEVPSFDVSWWTTIKLVAAAAGALVVLAALIFLFLLLRRRRRKDDDPVAPPTGY